MRSSRDGLPLPAPVYGRRFAVAALVFGLAWSMPALAFASTAEEAAPAERAASAAPSEAEAAAAGGSAAAAAAAGGARNYTLFESLMVVGGPAKIDQIPGSAHYIDNLELERHGYGDIHRVLRRVPGVFVQEEEGYGLRPNVGMRGTGSERSSKITLLEDGVLIAPAPYAAPAAYYFPTIGRMHSIEVRKGSSSIRQGPYTTGGVLNLISNPIPGALGGRLQAMAGEDGLRRLHASAGDSSERFGWLVETYQMETDGFKQLDGGGATGFELEDYLAKVRWNTAPGARVYQAIELKGGYTEQFGEETYLGLTEGDFRRTPFRRYAASQEDTIDTEHEQLQLSWLIAPRDGVEITTTAYRNDFFRNWHKLGSVAGRSISDVLASPEAFAGELAILRGEADSAPGALAVRNNRRDYYSQGVQTVAGFRSGSAKLSHDVEIGVRYHEDEEDRFQEDDRFQMVDGRMVLTSLGLPGTNANRVSSAEALAFFAQDRIASGRWTLTPGVRFESVDFTRVDYSAADPDRSAPSRVRENSVEEWIPGLGVDYRFSDANAVFFGVHKGFAPPGPGRDADTESEESVNYELGYRWSGDPARLQVVAFYNDYDNLLGRDTLSSGGSGSGDLFNGGEVEVEGLELSLDTSLDGWLAGFSSAVRDGALSVPLTLAYTHTRAEFGNSFESDFEPWAPNVVAGDELPYLPANQLFVGTGLSSERWSLFVDLSWVDEMRTSAGSGPIPAGSGTDSHFLLDLASRVRLFGALDLLAQVRNVTDEVYVAARRPAGARPGLPRTAMVGLSWEF